MHRCIGGVRGRLVLEDIRAYVEDLPEAGEQQISQVQHASFRLRPRVTRGLKILVGFARDSGISREEGWGEGGGGGGKTFAHRDN